MARINSIEAQIMALRPTASRRSLATFDIMQQAIVDIRKCIDRCQDYVPEIDEALARIDRYVKQLDAGN